MPDVLLRPIPNTSAERQQFANDAIARMKAIVNHKDFLTAVLNTKYSDTLFKPDEGNIISVKNPQVVSTIETGKEYKTTANNTIELLVEFDEFRDDDVVGGMTPPNPLITTNLYYIRQWMKNNDSLSLAAHWMHEWMHVAGFRHRSQKPDYDDVIYQVGYLFKHYGQLLALAAGEPSEVVALLGTGYMEAMASTFQNDESTLI